VGIGYHAAPIKYIRNGDMCKSLMGQNQNWDTDGLIAILHDPPYCSMVGV